MKNIRRDPARAFLVISTLNAFCVGLTFGTYVLFLYHLGLTPVQVNLTNCAFYLGRFFLEIPTGAVADTYGRRVSSLIAFALYGAGLLVYWQATTFLGCIAAELVLATGATCLSGAFEAWVVDELKACDRPEEIRTLFVREAIYDRVATIVGAPIGGLLATAYGMATPWLAAAAGMFLLLALAVLIMRESRVIVRHEGHSFGELVRTAQRSVRYAASPGPVRAFLLVSACFTFASMAPNMQWAPYFQGMVGGSSGTGILFSVLALLVLAGSWLAPRMRRWAGEDWAGLGATLVLAGIGIAAVPLLPLPFSLAPLALYEIANGMFNPLKKASLNMAIETDDRATVLSCEEMTSKLGGALGLFATGVLAQGVSIGAAWICGGLACLLAAWTVWHVRIRPIRASKDLS